MTLREIRLWKAQRIRQLNIYEGKILMMTIPNALARNANFIAVNSKGMQYLKLCLEKDCGRNDCLCTTHRSHKRVS